MILATFVAAAAGRQSLSAITRDEGRRDAVHLREGEEVGDRSRRQRGREPAFAMGKAFPTLEAYLAHLECFAAPIDKPWWREIRPGVYEHMTSVTNARREVATRAELLNWFGFSK